MKALVTVNHLQHQREHGEAIKAGLARHGIETIFGEYNAVSPPAADFAVIWGWKQPNIVKAFPGRVLVMERGYIGDRMRFTSVGWNGLNGRARFPAAMDHGDRLAHHGWGELLRPWRRSVERRALICGQVPGDSSIAGVDFMQWARDAARLLSLNGWAVAYRHHPMAPDGPVPEGVEATRLPMFADDLEPFSLCVTYNSNSAVDAVLCGTPTVAMDRGSMAWDVTTHDVDAAPIMPERRAWLNRLAWCQWSIDEIADGSAWDAVRFAAPELAVMA